MFENNFIKRDIPINIKLKSSHGSRLVLKDEAQTMMFPKSSNSTLLNDKSLNQDLSRNQYKIEKINKIKNGTFCTEAHPSIIHYPLCSDLPEPYNKLMRMAQTFDENDEMNAEIKNLNKTIYKEK